MVALINKNKVIFPVFAFLLRLKMKNKVIDKSEKPYFQVYIYLSRKFMYMILTLLVIYVFSNRHF